MVVEKPATCEFSYAWKKIHTYSVIVGTSPWLNLRCIGAPPPGPDRERKVFGPPTTTVRPPGPPLRISSAIAPWYHSLTMSGGITILMGNGTYHARSFGALR